jgi:hypothetical protein
MGTCCGCDFEAAKHSREFLDPIGVAQTAYLSPAGAPMGQLCDAVVPLTMARDLRQMRDAEHLSIARYFA